MRRIVVLPPAARDIQEAFEWHERQRLGLGEEILDSLQSVIDVTIDHPYAHPVIYRDTRRALLQRFPYGLFYQVHSEQIVIVACIHVRRNPPRWQSRS